MDGSIYHFEDHSSKTAPDETIESPVRKLSRKKEDIYRLLKNTSPLKIK